MNNGNHPLDLDQAVATAAPPPEVQRQATALEALDRLIAEPPQMPKIGLDASAMMTQAFETVASDVERLAKEAVDRALGLQQEARSYAEVLRQSGRILSDKIESETLRACQISLVMRRAQEELARPPDTPSPGRV